MWKLNSDKEKILKNIDIVLVSPQIPENIGLVARLLKNTSFFNLVLVSPNLTQESLEVAKRARDVLEKAKVFDNLKNALKESSFVFGTTRRIREYKFIYNFEDIKPYVISLAKEKKVSILFGKENFGLSKEELQLCDSIFYLSANSKFPSYNLAIACGLVCYGLVDFLDKLYYVSKLDLARKKDIESLFLYLERFLSLWVEKKRLNSTLNSLRRLFLRTHLTKNEVSLLKSLILKIEKLIR